MDHPIVDLCQDTIKDERTVGLAATGNGALAACTQFIGLKVAPTTPITAPCKNRRWLNFEPRVVGPLFISNFRDLS
jgi:hypothetical protein